MKAGMEPEWNELGRALTNIQPQVYTFDTTATHLTLTHLLNTSLRFH